MKSNQRTTVKLYQGVFYLAAGLIYSATILRSILLYSSTPFLGQILGILLLYMVLFLIDRALVKQSSLIFQIYIGLQTILICLLIYSPDFKEYDYFALLFIILGMQALQQLNFSNAAAWILLFLLLLAIPFIWIEGVLDGIIRLLLFGSVIIFMSAYSLAIRRAQEAHQHNQSLTEQLQEANLQLEAHSDTLKQLGIASERQRLRRELHDSVTQTIFSMTLTTQSALLLLERDPNRVETQLERLNQLTQSALAEMHTLIAELRPGQLVESSGGLIAELKKHVEGRQFPEGLAVSIEVDGDQKLSEKEDQGLFRIAQEALNNVVKHAHATRASINLHLSDPCWIEIEDNGQGFTPNQVHGNGQLGLPGMHERANEINWELTIISNLGAGTRVRVEKTYPAEKRQ